jgi:hypothetical protein
MGAAEPHLGKGLCGFSAGLTSFPSPPVRGPAYTL